MKRVALFVTLFLIEPFIGHKCNKAILLINYFVLVMKLQVFII